MSPTKPPEESYIVAYEPEKPLRKVIGTHTDLSRIFTKERIASCQNLINEAQKSFFDDIQGELSKMERVIADAAHSADMGAEQFEAISRYAHNICGHARLFNFTLITKLCEHLVENCENQSRRASTRLPLVAHLIQALHLAIKNKIINDGGAVGLEILARLGALSLHRDG